MGVLSWSQSIVKAVTSYIRPLVSNPSRDWDCRGDEPPPHHSARGCSCDRGEGDGQHDQRYQPMPAPVSRRALVTGPHVMGSARPLQAPLVGSEQAQPRGAAVIDRGSDFIASAEPSLAPQRDETGRAYRGVPCKPGKRYEGPEWTEYML